MEQRVAADGTEGMDEPDHKTGWMDAHLRVPNGYPLVSVRYSRLDGSGRHSADWSEDAILPISGYAAALARAIAVEGTSPQRILVEAVADPSPGGGGLAVELRVWADAIGLDEVGLQKMAMAVLQERTVSGALGLTGQTTVITKLWASAQAAAKTGMTPPSVQASRAATVSGEGGATLSEPAPVDGAGQSARLPGGARPIPPTRGANLKLPRPRTFGSFRARQLRRARAIRLSWPLMGNGFRLRPPRLAGRLGLSRPRPASGVDVEPGGILAGDLRPSPPGASPAQVHEAPPPERIRRLHAALKLPRPPLHGGRLMLASGALLALAILVVVFATLRAVPDELSALSGQLPATQTAAAPPDVTASRSDVAGQSATAVADPGVAVAGAEMAAGEAGGDATRPDVLAAGNAPAVTTATTAALTEQTTVGTEPAAAAATPVTGSTPLAAKSATPVQAVSAPRTLIDFSAQAASKPNWPNDPGSTAWFAPDGYHLAARRQGQFVAVGLLAEANLRDVVLTATFHKSGGPTGGGYGLILRDQGPGPPDGLNQHGRFLVVEVGDRGEIGMWRRDDEQWIDLLPWTASVAVRPLNAENVIAFKVVGDQLTLSVNGSEVATKTDATLLAGGAGVFLGGDDNQAVLTRLTLQTIE